MQRWLLVGSSLVLILVLVTVFALRGHATVSKTRIVFTSLENNNEEIFSVNEDGTDLRNLTQNPLNDFLATLSRDGNLITYNADTRYLADTQVFVMHADGTGKRQLTHIGNNYSPAFSPDGTHIVFHSIRDDSREIYLINTDGSGETRLTNNTYQDRNATFSPDGARIIFQSYRDGNWQIYTMNTDGANQTRLTTDTYDDTDPVYSPDGAWIAFSSTRSGGVPQIFIMSALQSNGVPPRQITNGRLETSHPWYSPDGRQIVYQYGPFYTSKIRIVTIDGTQDRPLLRNGPDGWSPCWGAR